MKKKGLRSGATANPSGSQDSTSYISHDSTYSTVIPIYSLFRNTQTVYLICQTCLQGRTNANNVGDVTVIDHFGLGLLP